MNNLDLLESRPKSTLTRLTRNSKLFKTAINAIQDKKGEKIVSLDLKKIPEAVSDFFIICTANNLVVHVMLEEPRKFYKIEEMWSDASRVEH